MKVIKIAIASLLFAQASAVTLRNNPSGVDKTVPSWVRAISSSNQGYTRDDDKYAPERYEGSGDDKLMDNLYKTYAFQGRDMNGKPNGQYYLSRHAFEAVAKEVISTHLKFSGPKMDSMFESRIPDIWDKNDVNDTGKVEVERIAPMLRQVIGDLET